MIIFTITGIIAVVLFFIIIIFSIIETRIKNKINEKTIWKMDKVETLTRGLSNERVNEKKTQ